MPQIINTNIPSLNAQRNLDISQSSLGTSLQRLSSGLRINSAKDDAAGLAITDRFTTQIKGLNQAARNANDGVSLAQTGEAALAQITVNLQRIRELAVQSANGTNSAGDRAALDLEVQQRLAQIDRIASQTAFNGNRILDGSFGTSAFQVGANVGETISLSINSGIRINQIGQIASATSDVATGVSSDEFTGTKTIQVGQQQATTIEKSIQGLQAGQSDGSAYAKAEAINASGVDGLTVTAVTRIALGAKALESANASTELEYSLTVNGVVIFDKAKIQENDASKPVISVEGLRDAINTQSEATGVNASISGSNLLLEAADGRDINVGQTFVAGNAKSADVGLKATSNTAVTVGDLTYNAGVAATGADAASGVDKAGAFSVEADANNRGVLTLTANDNIDLDGEEAKYGFSSSVIAIDTQTLQSANVKSVVASNNTISRVDSALAAVSDLRSTFGAIQNRFESTVTSLQATSENLTASRSRILDADFAVETANLTRGQILQQAGTAILAQANALPQNVLSLLG